VDLNGIGCDTADYIQLAQDRDQWWGLVNTVLDLQLAQDRDQW